MHSQLLVQEMVDHVLRDRERAGAHHNRLTVRPVVPGKGIAVAVSAVIGEALVRVGNLLRGDSVSRPAPVNS